MIVPDREHVSIDQAAEMCDVSRRTIYNWLQAEKIEAIRTAGGAIRIFTDTLFREFKSSELKRQQ